MLLLLSLFSFLNGWAPSELHLVSVREVKLVALVIKSENILGKHCCSINLDSGFCQSHQLHTDIQILHEVDLICQINYSSKVIHVALIAMH